MVKRELITNWSSEKVRFILSKGGPDLEKIIFKQKTNHLEKNL